MHSIAYKVEIRNIHLYRECSNISRAPCTLYPPTLSQVYGLEGGGSVLCVPPGTTWAIQDSVDATGAWIQSACVTTCPAHQKAAISKRDGYKTWQYSDSGWKDSDIKVSCTLHK